MSQPNNWGEKTQLVVTVINGFLSIYQQSINLLSVIRQSVGSQTKSPEQSKPAESPTSPPATK